MVQNYSKIEQCIEPFIHIVVRNPRTHISREKALYTDYEIVVKTNDIAFTCNESCVRRRYSDFQWLRKRLVTLYKWVTSPPELPAKRLFGRFQRQFLKRRQQGLQNFLERIVEDNLYLSDVAIHLFLQSTLPIKEIERHIDGLNGDADILDSLKLPKTGRQSALSRSMTEMPLYETETRLEHDSGGCYSTTSSINDLMHTSVPKAREDWRYYMSLPANLDKVNAVGTKSDNFSTQTKQQRTGLMQVDSGHLTSGSHQSLNRHKHSSESDCDFLISGDYDADDEYDDSYNDYESNPCSLFELDKRFRMKPALDLLRSRPKISERVFSSEDSDDEFHESEYDVIESHDEKEAAESLKRRNSLHKKKIGRSLSDVKLRPKVTRSASSSSMKERSERHKKFTSMPNIRAKSPLKSSKSFTFGRKSLASHKEENDETAELFRESVEGCSTSSSIGKCKSDEADESIVPNSEMDTWSNWNTPSKAKAFTLDSSDFDLSFDNSYECQSPKSISRALLEKLTFRKNARSPDEKPTLVGGRFRVSVIREEDNSSRRGSTSSCELTLKNSPLITTCSLIRPAETDTQLVSKSIYEQAPDSLAMVTRELTFDDSKSYSQAQNDTESMMEVSGFAVSESQLELGENLSNCLDEKRNGFTESRADLECEVDSDNAELSPSKAPKVSSCNSVPSLLSLALNLMAEMMTESVTSDTRQALEASPVVNWQSAAAAGSESHNEASSLLESLLEIESKLSVSLPHLVTVSDFVSVSEKDHGKIDELYSGFTKEEESLSDATNYSTGRTVIDKTKNHFNGFELKDGPSRKIGRTEESLSRKGTNQLIELIQDEVKDVKIDVIASKHANSLKESLSKNVVLELNANQLVKDSLDQNRTRDLSTIHNEYIVMENCVDECLKERAGSPTSAVLTTYDVIHDIPCNVEDYEIVDGKRDLLIC